MWARRSTQPGNRAIRTRVVAKVQQNCSGMGEATAAAANDKVAQTNLSPSNSPAQTTPPARLVVIVPGASVVRQSAIIESFG
jgi:hypothetical protein